MANYYRKEQDISTAKKFCETAMTLALSTGNTRRQSVVLCTLAWIQWGLGNYSMAQVNAYDAQRLARISADLYGEAEALNLQGMCCCALGNYKQGILLSTRARDLLNLCGMSNGDLDRGIMTTQTEIHKLRSEYVEARSIHTRILTIMPLPYSTLLKLMSLLVLQQMMCKKIVTLPENYLLVWDII
jgi:tetratricopeptide (TPR) repeat protein